MSSRYYPLFQRGNPQLRIFLPNFWMKIIRPEEPLPPNYVMFQTSIEMTDYDVKNYLEKIYKVPVVEVRTTIKSGLIRKAYGKQYLVKEDDYKEALVTLPRDQKFEFPDFTGKELKKKNLEKYNKMKEQMLKLQTKKENNYPGTPGWFF